jgi:hypothetical protein
MGHDFSLIFPALLDNYIWIKKNGLLEVPWFTPSFCGGFLNFAHPQGGVYSIPYILTIFFDPLSVVLLTFVMFAIIGFFSMYLLLRLTFCFSKPSSIFGSGLFLFNGFYSHRMLIGHFAFYSFMFAPLLLFFLLHPASGNKKEHIRSVLYIFSAGFIFAFMVYSGYLTLMIPTILSLIVVGIIYGFLYPGKLPVFWLRLGLSGFTGLLLSASKLCTIIYIMQNFSRSEYKLPGADNVLKSLVIAFKSVFISPAFDPKRIESLINQQWYLDRHEWEYSLTIVPLLFIFYGIIQGTLILIKNHNFNKLTLKKNTAPLLTMIFIVCLPVILNIYTPQWNSILKNVPIIKSASSLIRWYIIYIPFVVILSSLVLEKLLNNKTRWILGTIGLFFVILINGITDHEFYHNQFYNPLEIQEAYYKVKTGKWDPEIKYIATYVDEKGKPIRTINCNNILINDSSQLQCYEPLLGYNLDFFPLKSLHPGPVLDEHNGVLNIKNPACYVWSKANTCEPGDHFPIKEKGNASAFAKYRPFSFKIPLIQHIANIVNIMALLVVVLFFITYHLRIICTGISNIFQLIWRRSRIIN